jgi:hypothetical protein
MLAGAERTSYTGGDTLSGNTRLARAAAGILVGALLQVACAPGPGIGVPAPDEARGVPGFDTRDYPGDAAMRAWLESSPYRWVGYYLEAPCYTGTTWNGTRERVRGMGWGIALLFVGEQDWAEIVPADQVIADPTAPRCTRANLTADRGRTDGSAAATAAEREGFPRGTAIFLNVERVERVSTDLREYVRAWTAALLDDGRYLPALYAHAHNADELHGVQREVFARVDRADAPRLWVARTGGFNLRRGPTESGFPAAHIWQGILDTSETWGGVTLHIDANVARTANPSG